MKVYVVVKHRGEYEDYRASNVAVFRTQEEADKYVADNTIENIDDLAEAWWSILDELEESNGFDLEEQVEKRWEIFSAEHSIPLARGEFEYSSDYWYTVDEMELA